MALFDKLATPVKYTAINAENAEEVESVCKHISLLLNSRRGVLSPHARLRFTRC